MQTGYGVFKKDNIKNLEEKATLCSRYEVDVSSQCAADSITADIKRF